MCHDVVVSFSGVALFSSLETRLVTAALHIPSDAVAATDVVLVQLYKKKRVDVMDALNVGRTSE